MSRFFTQRISAQLFKESDGIVELATKFDIHDDLQSLSLGFPDYLTPEEASGFSQAAANRWEWDETDDNPWIWFRYSVNRGGMAGFEFVDTGGWALLQYPPFNTSWRYTGSDLELRRHYHVSGEGIASSDGSLVYLGPHREERFNAGGQLFRLAIPEQASLKPPLEEVKESLCFATENLDVGGKNDEVVVVVAPSNINWSGEGLQSGANGFWAVDSSRVDYAGNTWIHEYVHTRQEWSYDESALWLVEGTTNYYSALFSLLNDSISFEEFQSYLDTNMHSESVLVDPTQWSSPTASYTKGRRIVAALDVKIRRETNSRRTFEDVFRKMNEFEGSLSHDAFKRIVRDVGGHSLDEWLEKYVEGSESPDLSLK